MNPVSCSVCGQQFVPRFTYQTSRLADGSSRYFCSVACRTGPVRDIASEASAKCGHCGIQFRVQYALQVVERPDGRHYYCTETCRRSALEPEAKRNGSMRVIAVLNQKGGTGKTTTAVSVAAELASRGQRVLLVDADAQGNVAVSLGVKAERGLYHVLIDGADPRAVAVEARPGLSVITADQTLSAVERTLGSKPDRWWVMAQRFQGAESAYDVAVIDCAPSVSLIGHNALVFAQELIVPVSCDYLALVGVKQVLATVRYVNETLTHPVRVLGVLPTFFDARSRICRQSVEALQAYFRDKVMPTVRVSTAFKEAPSLGRTIFEHAARGRGAEDYRAVVDWLQGLSPSDAVVVTRPPANAFGSVLTSEA